MGTRRISMEKRSRLALLPGASAPFLILLTIIPSLTSALSLHNSVWARPRIPSPPDELFSRDSSCGDPSYVPCPSAGLPPDFCCPSGQTCIPLAGNTTAVCCPAGSDCAEIETIPCELSLEDKSQHPAAVVMTNALTGTLEKCGSQCCPFGYSCNSNGVCDMNKDQSAKPSTTSVASPSTATSGSGTSSAAVNPTSGSPGGTGSSSNSSSTASALADSTATSSSGASSPGGSSSSTDSSSRAGVVVGGVIGGLAGAVLLGFLILFCVKKERRRKLAEKDDPSSNRSSSFGNILASPVTKGSSPVTKGSARGPISKPIPSEDMVRSDFGRMVSPHAHSFANGGAALGPGGVSEYGEKMHDDDGFYDDSYDEDARSNIHEVPRSPPRVTAPRDASVSSMYASYYDPLKRDSAYESPPRMPSPRAYGGSHSHGARDSLGDSLGDYGGQRSTGDPNAGYIDVFADSGALAPPPLRKLSADRVTRFSDVMDDAKKAMGGGKD